jgi:hypothetical protein
MAPHSLLLEKQLLVPVNVLIINCTAHYKPKVLLVKLWGNR